ncbi:testis-specific Y-encoded protein 9-like [Ochotona princeps]|uniref:testis-specific Y-encoded protein 9-like n=1 Tax=Ochotona princeps TaxID=9978 RepID=UPI002714C8DF|nr:testis-specific Y-encoded protein 9-like [Ochotona princeps]
MAVVGGGKEGPRGALGHRPYKDPPRGKGPRTCAVTTAVRARERLKQRLLQRREVLMQHRGIIIQNIPGFWAKVFVNHPQMSAMVRDKDQDILSYMINVQVEELEHPHNCYKIMLFFGINPYFSNELIVKEYLSNVNGYSAYHSTPVKWLQDYKREAHSYRYYNNSLSIFNWLADHTFVGSNWIAEIICKDIWLNPLPYYFGAQASGDSIEHPEHFKN